jgi:hypothetical protein
MVIAAAGTFTTWRIHSHPPACRPVRALIDFNRTTQASLKAKTYLPPAGSYDEPRVPTDADYHAWTDGMQQRADRVTAPGLSAHAHRAAELTREFLTTTKQMNAELDKQGPLAPQLPPSAKAMARIERDFGDEMRALQDACPA